MERKAQRKIVVIDFRYIRQALAAQDNITRDNSMVEVKTLRDKEREEKEREIQLEKKIDKEKGICWIPVSVWTDKQLDWFFEKIFQRNYEGYPINIIDLVFLKKSYSFRFCLLAEYPNASMQSHFFKKADLVLGILTERCDWYGYGIVKQNFELANELSLKTILVCVFNDHSLVNKFKASKEYRSLRESGLVTHEIEVHKTNDDFSKMFYKQLDKIVSAECPDLPTIKSLAEKELIEEKERESSEIILGDKKTRCVIF